MSDAPGVIIREIPSGSAPISGVATSNAAFVGCFARGPVGQATRIASYGEFERLFGGLHADYESSYAVRSFFLNGGGVAFIVRTTAELDPKKLPEAQTKARTAKTAQKTAEAAAAASTKAALEALRKAEAQAEAARKAETEASEAESRAASAEGDAAEAAGAAILATLLSDAKMAEKTAAQAQSDEAAAEAAEAEAAEKAEAEAAAEAAKAHLDKTTADSVAAAAAKGAAEAQAATTKAAADLKRDEAEQARTQADQAALEEAAAHEAAAEAADKAGVDAAEAAAKAALAAAAAKAASTAAAASVEIDDSAGVKKALRFIASSPGSWGDALSVGIARAPGADRFDLLVRETRGDRILREEQFLSLSPSAQDPRYVVSVLEKSSESLRALPLTAGAQPQATLLSDGVKRAAGRADLRELSAGRLTPLTQGADGVLPGDTEAWQGAVLDAIGGSEDAGTGLHALDAIAPDVFNLMCLPDLSLLSIARSAAAAAVYQVAHKYCARNFAFLLVDPPKDAKRAQIPGWAQSLGSEVRRDAALYYPCLRGLDPLDPTQERDTAPSGAIAGIYARTDAARGVWKAPAGVAAGLTGGRPVEILNDRQQGPLNMQGVNVLRSFPVYSNVVWGARTLDGADALASEWRYVPVRRLALFIENSLLRGLQWAVFEPNDEPLWASVRVNLNAFMSQLHRKGAFQGASARDAYLVKCDRETTTPADVDLGVLNVYVGFAPVRPAEFVVLRIQQRLQTSA